MKTTTKKILCSSFLISIFSIIAVYLFWFLIHLFLKSISLPVSNLSAFIIIFFLYAAVSVFLWMNVKACKHPEEIKLKLSLIYVTLVLSHCLIATIFVPQPGGIDLICRILSPIMGPWSRFLPPNSLRYAKCTLDFMIFTGVISLLVPISIASSFCVRDKIIWHISVIVSLTLTFAWSGYGLYRIILDLM